MNEKQTLIIFSSPFFRLCSFTCMKGILTIKYSQNFQFKFHLKDTNFLMEHKHWTFSASTVHGFSKERIWEQFPIVNVSFSFIIIKTLQLIEFFSPSELRSFMLEWRKLFITQRMSMHQGMAWTAVSMECRSLHHNKVELQWSFSMYRKRGFTELCTELS